MKEVFIGSHAVIPGGRIEECLPADSQSEPNSLLRSQKGVTKDVFTPVTGLLPDYQGKCSPSGLGRNGYGVI
jgi:hypothetical protein